MKKKQDIAVRLQVRLPQSLHEQIRQSADAESRSLNGQIVFALSQWAGAQQKDSPADGPEVSAR